MLSCWSSVCNEERLMAIVAGLKRVIELLKESLLKKFKKLLLAVLSRNENLHCDKSHAFIEEKVYSNKFQFRWFEATKGTF